MQPGAVVVYVIDVTSSQQVRRDEMLAAFERLIADHQSTPDVRVAAIKHGYASHYSGEDSDIVPVPEAEDLKNNLFGLRPPGAVPLASLKDKKTGIALSRAHEQLYPAIDAARLMIEDECQGFDLTTKPWCRNKVIVAMGDGDPGVSRTDGNYYDSANPKTPLPENLLSSLSVAGVRVDTLCIRYGDALFCNGTILIWRRFLNSPSGDKNSPGDENGGAVFLVRHYRRCGCPAIHESVFLFVRSSLSRREQRRGG